MEFLGPDILSLTKAAMLAEPPSDRLSSPSASVSDQDGISLMKTSLRNYLGPGLTEDLRQRAEKTSSPRQLGMLAAEALIKDNMIPKFLPALNGASLGSKSAKVLPSPAQSHKQNDASGSNQAGRQQLSPRKQPCTFAVINRPSQVSGGPENCAAPVLDDANASPRDSLQNGAGKEQDSPSTGGEATNPFAEDTQKVVKGTESSSQPISGESSTEGSSAGSGTTESAEGQELQSTTPGKPCEEIEPPSQIPSAQGMESAIGDQAPWSKDQGTPPQAQNLPAENGSGLAAGLAGRSNVSLAEKGCSLSKSLSKSANTSSRRKGEARKLLTLEEMSPNPRFPTRAIQSNASPASPLQVLALASAQMKEASNGVVLSKGQADTEKLLKSLSPVKKQKSPPTRHPALARIFDKRHVSSSRDADEGCSAVDANPTKPPLASPAKSLRPDLQAAEQAVQRLSAVLQPGKKPSANAVQCGTADKQTASPAGRLPVTRRSNRRSSTKKSTRDVKGGSVSLLDQSAIKQTRQPKPSSLKELGSELKSSKSKEKERSRRQQGHTAFDFSEIKASPGKTPTKLTPAAQDPSMGCDGIASGSSQKLRSARELHHSGLPQLTLLPEAARKLVNDSNDLAEPSGSTKKASGGKRKVNAASDTQHTGPLKLELKLCDAKAKIKAEPQVGRPVRARAPPVAFWANERARVDPKTGVTVLEKPQQDWLAFGRPAVKAETSSKSPAVKTEKISRENARAKLAVAAAASRRGEPVASKSPKQNKAPPSKPALRQKPKPTAKSPGKDESPPSPPKTITNNRKPRSNATETAQPQAKKPKSKAESDSIAALAMQAGKTAAEASPKKRSRHLEDLPSPQALAEERPTPKKAKIARNAPSVPGEKNQKLRIGVYPRCSPCKRQRSGHKYCGTETAIKACLNWPTNNLIEPENAAQAAKANGTAESTPVRKGKVNGKGNGKGRVSEAGQKRKGRSDPSESQAEINESEAEPLSPQDEARRLLLDDDWTESQLTALQAAWLREVDPTARGFWQRVAKLVPGRKTADECHAAYMSQFGSTPSEKPKTRNASRKAAPADKGKQGKKPTKVAVRKMARQARWQQQVENSGTPLSGLDTAQKEEQLQEIKQRREKADKYIDILLRRKAAWRLQVGPMPTFDSNNISQGASVQGASVFGDSVYELGSMLHEESQHSESDEEAEKDDYFSDE